MSTKSLKIRLQEGLEGKYSGLKNGLIRINNYIFGTQRGVYYLLGGLSGTFKTTFCDFWIQHTLDDAKKRGIECNIFYYSYEIDELSKKCNWLSNAVYRTYRVVISPETIKGLGDFRMTEEEQKLVYSLVDEVEELMNNINFRFDACNPTGIYHELFQFFESKGTILKEKYTNELGEIKYRITGYIPNNPNSYTIAILDHAALQKKEREFSTKEVIDKLSEYFVVLRNTFKLSVFLIQQFNQGLSSIDRQKYKGVDISPQHGDFRDSTNPYNDADVVMGLMNPYKLDLETCLGYNVEKLNGKMLMLKIIKNRLSTDNIAVGLYADPKSGSFSELPEVNKIKYTDYD